MSSKVQLSIKPRNWPAPFSPGREKSNTAKPPKKSPAAQKETK